LELVCYSPNQRRFEQDVGKLVPAGMALSAAMSRLFSRGFAAQAT
jgi:hypothetical protein